MHLVDESSVAGLISAEQEEDLCDLRSGGLEAAGQLLRTRTHTHIHVRSMAYPQLGLRAWQHSKNGQRPRVCCRAVCAGVGRDVAGMEGAGARRTL